MLNLTFGFLSVLDLVSYLDIGFFVDDVKLRQPPGI